MIPEIEKLKIACEEVRKNYCRKRKDCSDCCFKIENKTTCGLLGIELTLMRAAKNKNDRIVWNYNNN